MSRLTAKLPAGRLMLASGLIMMAFLATHLANHALALISLEAAETGRYWFLLVWRSLPGESLLLLALLVHLCLAFRAVWRLRSWRLPFIDLAQLVLGFTIPWLLSAHLLSTGGLHRLIGLDDSYLRVLRELWPDNGWWQTLLTLVAWLHGCIGCWRRLRLDARARSWMPTLQALALLLPVLALMGFVSGGRAVALLEAQAPALIAALARLQAWPSAAQAYPYVVLPRERFLELFYAGLVFVLLAVWLRHLLLSRRQGVKIDYGGGIVIRGLRGATLLEMSRQAGLAHASVCGGRGRCSTCRVRILGGGQRLMPPGPLEHRVLERIGAGPDIRLACQINPLHSLKVVRLVAKPQAFARVMTAMHPEFGQEREIVAMFVDIRGFTRLSEQRLPFDVIFLLNRFFASMGQAIEAEGGHLDKFVGDGIVAFFGLMSTPQVAARAALHAARAMAGRLDELNAELAAERMSPDSPAGEETLSVERIRIGIGLHAGPAILGEVGFGRARALTAIGDTVNVASRLETLNKDLGTQLAVSRDVLDLASIANDALVERVVDIRGRQERLKVAVFADARELDLPAGQGPNRPRTVRERLVAWQARSNLARAGRQEQR